MSFSEKTWRELTPEQIKHFYSLCADRAEKLGNLVNSVWMEFAKYLFAANAGSAAGLFLMPDSSSQRSYLLAFSLFCMGTFCVGIAWFAGWSWVILLSDEWNRDFNALMQSKFTFGELDERSRIRNSSFRKSLSRIGVILSFCFLIAGGAIAAKAFWSKPVAVIPTSTGHK